MYTLCNSNEYIFIFERYMRNFNEEIRKMKKITALLLVLAMAVALCACGSSTDSSTPAADTAASDAAPAAETLVMGTSADVLVIVIGSDEGQKDLAVFCNKLVHFEFLLLSNSVFFALPTAHFICLTVGL